jgi:hypothetical protein
MIFISYKKRSVIPFDTDTGPIYVYKKAYEFVTGKRGLYFSVEVKARQVHITYHNFSHSIEGVMILKDIGPQGKGYE